MKTIKYAVAAAIALTGAIAVPAAANEVRVEARGGIFWAGGDEEATAGAALGYDFDLGSTVFAGAEVSADKVLVDGADVYFGLTGRIGTKIGENAKLFAAGGYTVGEGEDVPHLGAGVEYALNQNLYVKTEYRHFFGDNVDGNAAVVGLGLRF